MTIPLLSTKFNIPSSGKSIVHRQRLMQFVDDGIDQSVSVILVSALAGYGKTTVISILMVILAWFRFIKRDIRLSGEGSWKFEFLPKHQKNTAHQAIQN